MPGTLFKPEATMNSVPGALSPAPRVRVIALPAAPLAPPLEAPAEALGFFRRVFGVFKRSRREVTMADAEALAERPLGNAYDHSFSGHGMVRL